MKLLHRNRTENILFLTEYFYPYTHGGTEWSVYYLARLLLKKRINVVAATPNYGSRKIEIWKKIKIIRTPFFRKLESNSSSVSPYWLSNIFFQIVTFIAIMRILRHENIQIIHVHGNYFLPPALIASKIFNKPILITLRDYQILCSYGFCLNKNNHYKRCNLKQYLSKEVMYYINYYHSKLTFFKYFFIFLSSIRARLLNYYLSFFLHKVNKIICISKKHEKIFNINGFSKTTTIPNPFSVIKSNKIHYENTIFFAGRLTPGKGAHILVNSFISFFKNNNIKLNIAGDGFLKKKLLKIVNKNNLSGKIKFLNHISHTKVISYIQKSKIVVVPSVWEEPFGRLALESLLLGVPVVASNRGGLPEIIEDKVTGYIVEPTEAGIKDGILLALKNNKKLRSNIKRKLRYLEKKYNNDVVDSYLKIYHSI